MTQRFHPRSVGRLPPGLDPVTGEPCRAEYFDAEVRGLSVRVTASGKRSYYWTYCFRGRTRRVRVASVDCVSLAEARATVRRMRGRLECEGADLAGQRAEQRRVARLGGALTVARLLERCLAAITIKPKTRTEWTRLAAREINPTIGTRPAEAVTRADVRALLAPIVARAPYIANRTFDLLRRVYRWAIAEDLVGTSPCTGLTKPVIEHARERVLSRAELQALLRALDVLGGKYSDVIRLLLWTGVREANVLGMHADELVLDSEAPRWVIPAARMKAGQVHIVPLVPRAVDLIKRRLARPEADAESCALVFPAARGVRGPSKWSTVFMRELRKEVDHQAALLADGGAAVKSPLTRWTVHGLRHTLATQMREELRVPRDIVALILAHRVQGGTASTARYDRAELLEERRAALVAWAAWLDRLGDGGARVLPLVAREPRSDFDEDTPAAPDLGRARGGRKAGA